MIYGTVLCLGDSLTFGARSEYGRGYPEELSMRLTNHFKQEWSAINHGVNGETSLDVLRRAFASIRSFATLPGAKWGTLLAGTNDSKNPDYPIELYKDNMRQIIQIFLRHDINLIIGTLPPVEGNCMPCFDSKRSNGWISSANEAILALREEYSLKLVTFEDLGNYLIDGVHMNYEGYCKMADRWFEVIRDH
ncbi:MAG: SGNH/GDSL hydrolase family protein [Bdellovibrionales bacterium]|nr:SGNH/GDSL hydrolase family protein [Bdellovibrionales bacterium]